MRNLFYLLTAATLVAGGACAPSAQAPSSGGTSAPSTAPTAATGATTAPSKPATGGQPQAGGAPSGTQEVTINALQGEPDNLDPNRSSFATEAAAIRQVFEPLLRFDKDLKPAPAMAERWEVSQDGKTYTFHLRKDAKYSDGTPVRAQDFVYSYKRILDPKLAAEYATLFVEAGIVGAKAYNEGKGPAEAIGLSAKDDATFEVQLEQPIGYFPNLAALWVVPALRQDIIDKNPDGWATDPSTYIGSGPFKMSEWVHQDHITFVPNPNYSGGGQKPKLEKVTYLMGTSLTTDYAAYRADQRDWALVPDPDVNVAKSDPQLSKEYRDYTELTTFWVQMNNARKPLDNPLVRKAISRSIDRQALIRDIASGVGKPATSVIPPGMPGYQEGLGKDIDFDPAAAKELLRQAGYADPSQFPHIVYRFATTTANQTRAEFVQAQLKQNLGITIDLEPMEAKAYQAAFKAKEYDMAYGGWGADYPDPQNWMTGLFSCNATNNKYNYCNPTFDEQAKNGDTQTDQNARLQAYAQAQQTLVNDLPVIPLFYRGRAVVVKPYVQNLVITPKDDFPGVNLLDQVFLTK